MRIQSLNEMTKGWFIGNFSPTALKTDVVEVAVKRYQKGESEASHYHKIATELTVIISGSVKMNQKTYVCNDIIIIEPGESTNFEALEDTICTVVKFPGALNDKYPARNN